MANLLKTLLNKEQQPISALHTSMKKDTDEYIPTKETLAAMKEAREGNLKTYNSVQGMMDDFVAKISKAEKSSKRIVDVSKIWD